MEGLQLNSSLFNEDSWRNQVLAFIKTELANLKKIDNVIKELLRPSEDLNFKNNLEILLVQSDQDLETLEVKLGEKSFPLMKEIEDRLKQQFRILIVVECTIFVPILSSPKWIKGLICEKEFEMQIFAPGFTLDEEKFQLIVLEFNSEFREPLIKFADGRVFLLYTNWSSLSEENRT